ncbi:hypothetical protein B0J15DRAFT_59093 [Fusarium solani]|uniref:Uncharacterized protein n=1 Tax=Fusarium solani TaxID=169388 RepID=A0A9P9H0J7_FUSSL|nr:uncharacterized protein B0J15DRAFT_59093 [Fusarium solani]KAH7248153.1 hypothetical protein B0J15DRAFT_59093 [Fusarium solani]
MSQENLPTTSNSSLNGDAIVVAQGVTEPPAEHQDVTPLFPKPFVCDVCKSSYARLDHLARHFRSHGQQKPFVCPHCNKQFARPDILKRHVGTHLDPKAGFRTGSGKRRTRAARACTFCAESKLRCEGTDPCQRCRDRGLKCQYTQRPRTRKAPGGPVSEGTRVGMTESPAPSDEGDPASPSGVTEESTEHHARASFTDASDLSQSVSGPRVGSHADNVVQPFTPMSFDTGLPMDDADLFADFLRHHIRRRQRRSNPVRPSSVF